MVTLRQRVIRGLLEAGKHEYSVFVWHLPNFTAMSSFLDGFLLPTTATLTESAR